MKESIIRVKKTTFLQKAIQILNTFGGHIIHGMISIYQYTISPDKGIFSYFLKGRVCAHEPHCSAYGKECVKRYGLFPGITYTTERVLSCKPAMQKTYDPSHYRIVFFSGSPIGIPFLEYLVDDPRFEIVGVVTMPDKPIGRGQQYQENTIGKTAKRLGINTVFTPHTLTKTEETMAEGHIAAQLQSLQADWFFVIAYGKIIPQYILDIPTFGSINVHGSLLPTLRGASPLQSVFLENRQLNITNNKRDDNKNILPSPLVKTAKQLSFQTGFTIMHINEKMDEGDIVASYTFNVPFSRTAQDLFTKVGEKGPAFLADSIWDLSKGHILPTQQDHEKATYCKKISKEDGKIDIFKTPLSYVYAAYRAYAIRPKIWTTRKGKVLLIEKIICDEQLFLEYCKNPIIIDHNGDHGYGNTISKKTISLNPAIQEIYIKPEGKKAMSRKEFVNGYIKNPGS